MFRITKTEFEKAYKKFKPCKLEKFFLKYISLRGVYDSYRYVIFVISLLLLPLAFEIFAISTGLSQFCQMIPSLIYAIISSVVGVLWSTVLIQKRRRFIKIQKYLDVTDEEFKQLTEIYFYNRYNSCNDFIGYNSTYKKDEQR